MTRRLNLKTRLSLQLFLMGFLPLTIMGGLAYKISRLIIKSHALEEIQTIGQLKARAVEEYFDQTRRQVIALAASRATIEATTGFAEAVEKYLEDRGLTEGDLEAMRTEVGAFYRDDFGRKYQEETKKAANAAALISTLSPVQIALQKSYIVENKNPLGEKHRLDEGGDGTFYDDVHAKYHPEFRLRLESFGYYDVFLIDSTTGTIVYSVYKEIDFVGSLIKGTLAQTNLAEVFQEANTRLGPGEFAIVDYKSYLPSYEAPASFIASPIFDGEKRVGVLAIQLPIERVSGIMNSRIGLGETGEAFLVGPDGRLRSDTAKKTELYNVVRSFRDPDAPRIEMAEIGAALEGKTAEVETVN